MGGHALKNVETIRYNKKEYVNIEKYAIDILKFLFPNKLISSIPYLKEKESFGDLDILITSPNEKDVDYTISKVIEYFKPTEYFKNGLVFTFHIDNFQIDLIFTKKDDLKMSWIYYQNNDAGMLIGRMAHSIGMKYGPTGLHLYIYSDDNSRRLGHIILTNRPTRVFKILGLNYNRFKKGFNNYEELYEYLSTSHLFAYDVFDQKLIRAEDRRRDNKRNSIHIFKKWLELNHERFTRQFKHLNTDERINFVNELFPEHDIFGKVKRLKEADKKLKEVHDKWNGNIIQEKYPKLIKKELGQAMDGFKIWLPKYYKKFKLNCTFEEWILFFDIDTIFEFFAEYLQIKGLKI